MVGNRGLTPGKGGAFPQRDEENEAHGPWLLFDYYLTTKVLKDSLLIQNETPQYIGKISKIRYVLAYIVGRHNHPLSLVRMRSPVQIWLAAPKNRIVMIRFFCFFRYGYENAAKYRQRAEKGS